MIFHITTKKEWKEAQEQGEYIAPSLSTDGFIHCSTATQTEETANSFFKGQSALVLLQIDEDKLKAECKYEPPAGGANHHPTEGELFPHVYGAINLDAIVKVFDFQSDADGFFTLPDELEV